MGKQGLWGWLALLALSPALHWSELAGAAVGHLGPLFKGKVATMLLVLVCFGRPVGQVLFPLELTGEGSPHRLHGEEQRGAEPHRVNALSYSHSPSIPHVIQSPSIHGSIPLLPLPQGASRAQPLSPSDPLVLEREDSV